jgi:hypothetical protein
MVCRITTIRARGARRALPALLRRVLPRLVRVQVLLPRPARRV